ncbi:MAG: hypothetical protein J6Q81_02455 [Lentisphaeria bacterium]|nr:hypothetical protein [Lentisphaeria bacterium]
MSIKSVLTELSNAIQSKANCRGPLTLQAMTNAVKSITSGSSSSSVKFYRCEEYSPTATVIHIEQGLLTLRNGTKISLTGEYILQDNSWICNATVPQEDYQSIAAVITAQEYSGGSSSYGERIICDRDDISNVFASAGLDTLYPEDTVFQANYGNTIDREIVLSGNSGSFSACYSGYEISKNTGYWQQSSVLTKGIPAKGYIPEPGKIYSENSDMAVNSIYPEVPPIQIKFYECASYTPDFAGGMQYSFTLVDSSDDNTLESSAVGTYIRTKWVEDTSDIESYLITAKWENENGWLFIEECDESGIFSYRLESQDGSKTYGTDEPFWTRITDYNTLAIYDWDIWETIQVNFSEWQPTELPPTVESWSGYEMVKYNQECTFVVSNADREDCNGVYTMFKYSSHPNDIVYSNGIHFLCTHIGIDLQHIRWTICDNPTLGAADINYFYTTTSFDSSETISPINAVWQGSIEISQPPDGWIKSNNLKENLQAAYLTPRPGEIYSEDTSIRVRKMHDGATYPIPSEGLLFYAPLQENYIDLVSGQAAQITGGVFTSHHNISCLQLDGSEYLKWQNNIDLPSGSSAYSMVILAAPTANSDWRAYISMGETGGSEFCLHAKNGHFQEWGGSRITDDGIWQSLIITRNESGKGKAYYNGKKNGSGSDSASIPESSALCIGANIADYFGQKCKGYIAFAAVYNRELSAEEVLTIHNTLIEM